MQKLLIQVGMSQPNHTREKPHTRKTNPRKIFINLIQQKEMSDIPCAENMRLSTGLGSSQDQFFHPLNELTLGIFFITIDYNLK